MKDSIYYRQAKRLLRILPIIERYPIFALKGGTAINFFIRDMPRLSNGRMIKIVNGSGWTATHVK